MEEKEVEELVGGEGEEWWRMAGQRRAQGCFCCCHSLAVVGGKKMKEKNERERKGSGVNI